MKKWWIGVCSLVLGCTSLQETRHQERTALYILETAKAFRTVYANSITEQTKRAGITPKEDWAKDDHAIMLPIQFIKAAGSEIHDFELGLIGLTPIYRSNLPKNTGGIGGAQETHNQPTTKARDFLRGEPIQSYLGRLRNRSNLRRLPQQSPQQLQTRLQARRSDGSHHRSSRSVAAYPQQPESNCRRW